jgi:hypothetical protein
MSAGLKEFTDAIGTSFDIVKRATTQGLQTFRGGVQSAFGDLLFGDEERKEANKAAKELEDLLGRIPGLDLGTLTRGGGLAEASKDELSSIFDAALARDLPPSAVAQIERLRGEMFGVFAQPTSEGQDAFEESLTDTIASLTQKQSLLNKFKTFGDDMGDSAAEGLKAAITNGMADFTLKTLEQFVEWNYETWAKDVYQGLIGIVKQFVKWNYETWGKEVYQVLIAPLKQFVEWNYETWAKGVVQALISPIRQFVEWNYETWAKGVVQALISPIRQVVNWAYETWVKGTYQKLIGKLSQLVGWDYDPVDSALDKAGVGTDGFLKTAATQGVVWKFTDYNGTLLGEGFTDTGLGTLNDTMAWQGMGYIFSNYPQSRVGQGFSLDGNYNIGAWQPTDYKFSDYKTSRVGEGFNLRTGNYSGWTHQWTNFKFGDYLQGRRDEGFDISTGDYSSSVNQWTKFSFGDYLQTRRGQGFDISTGDYSGRTKQWTDYSFSDYLTSRSGQGFNRNTGAYSGWAKPVSYTHLTLPTILRV